mmetsp:Transcript_61972/g.128201  ORF Transcript_61972/g.128201 Transcript_61972/m.128201 type:complete len:348 (+) Transcript_61972:390-1433(+)
MVSLMMVGSFVACDMEPAPIGLAEPTIPPIWNSSLFLLRIVRNALSTYLCASTSPSGHAPESKTALQPAAPSARARPISLLPGCFAFTSATATLFLGRPSQNAGATPNESSTFDTSRAAAPAPIASAASSLVHTSHIDSRSSSAAAAASFAQPSQPIECIDSTTPLAPEALAAASDLSVTSGCRRMTGTGPGKSPLACCCSSARIGRSSAFTKIVAMPIWRSRFERRASAACTSTEMVCDTLLSALPSFDLLLFLPPAAMLNAAAPAASGCNDDREIRTSVPRSVPPLNARPPLENVHGVEKGLAAGKEIRRRARLRICTDCTMAASFRTANCFTKFSGYLLWQVES